MMELPGGSVGQGSGIVSAVAWVAALVWVWEPEWESLEQLYL